MGVLAGEEVWLGWGEWSMKFPRKANKVQFQLAGCDTWFPGFGGVSAHPDAGAGRGWARLPGSGGSESGRTRLRTCRVAGALWVAEGSWDEKHLGAPVPKPFLPTCPWGVCLTPLSSQSPVPMDSSFSPPKLESLWYGIWRQRPGSVWKKLWLKCCSWCDLQGARTVKWTMQVQIPNPSLLGARKS